MSTSIASLENLIHELTKLPGVGEKTAQRLAYFILKTPDYSNDLQEALIQVRENIHTCPQCYSFTDLKDLCHICSSPQRDVQMICVVEEPTDIFKVETAGVFRGLYHVLHGVISPLDGIGPNDLKITELIHRVEESQKTPHPIREVICALDADLEGDTTALYLQQLLVSKGAKLTRLAYGVPFGADMDYIDRRTLGRALENRVEL